MRDFTLDESARTEADDRLDRLLTTAHTELVDAIRTKQHATAEQPLASTAIRASLADIRMTEPRSSTAHGGPDELLQPATPGTYAPIRRCRQALSMASDTGEVLWAVATAFDLGVAIGSRLAVSGPVKLSAVALKLAHLCGRGQEVLPHDRRADIPELHGADLTDGDDLPQLLRDTANLLGEAAVAVVGLACAVDDEGTYWMMMETIDALDEATDCTHEMLRRLSAHDPAPSNWV
ncbi:DUF6099 family protein [Streptomyces sp. NPDC017936]|uniref:DUF6099 family protein n=1 Tax=Streptomyces sp. NPDC017936 TaxID=3365016 RepID=UPI0037B776FA